MGEKKVSLFVNILKTFPERRLKNTKAYYANMLRG
jgi:hypothetical protein